MNDPMPPESLPPESTSFSSAIPPVTRRDDDPAAVAGNAGGSDRRKYDELIAVVIALLGVGSILFWVLGKSNPIAGKLPLGGAVAGDTNAGGAGNSGAGGNLPNLTPGANANGGGQLFRAGESTNDSAGRADGDRTSANRNGNDRGNGQNWLAGGAAIGAAGAAAAGNAEASTTPTTPTTTATAPTAPTTTPTSETPQAAVTAPATQTTPEIVEEDKLAEATTALKFSDVPPSSPLSPYVDALSSRGVLDQFDDGTLNPDAPISRAEFAQLVSKAFGKPRIKPAIAFSDVPADSPKQAAVEEATRTGFMTGFPDGSFKPNLTIPRYQMQVAIVTGTQFAPGGDPVQALSKFADRDAIPQWAVPKVATAVGAGVMPTPDKSVSALMPAQDATRGEAVVMLHEALVKEGKLPAVK